jgi:hypothetical protein
MAPEEQVIATFEQGSLCDGCSHFEWGPGGPDPCDCRVLRGDAGTSLDDCPGTEE